MRVLTFTNLYPGEDRPRHGIFVEERLRQLAASGELAADAIALRPSAAACLPGGLSGEASRTRRESRYGITVQYLAVPTLPGLTNWIDPWLWSSATEESVRSLLGRDSKDTILDAHFLYPDGVAAVLLGKRLGLPIVMTARGSDVNVKCEHPVMRRWVRWAAANCSALITVSQALAGRLDQHGIKPPILEVLPNGVDLERFRPRARGQLRERMQLAGRVIVSAGHLLPEKGHAIAIEALAELPGTTLLVVGEGPERGALRNLARDLGVEPRVRFLGAVPHEQMPDIYSCADALVLASAREGMPNVVLESLACGTRVVATDVGGIGEVVTSSVAGCLIRDRSAAALREGLARLFTEEVPVERTRDFAQRFSWAAVVHRQLGLYRRVLAEAACRQSLAERVAAP